MICQEMHYRANVTTKGGGAQVIYDSEQAFEFVWVHYVGMQK